LKHFLNSTSTATHQKLELTWIGKDQRPRLEPCNFIKGDNLTTCARMFTIQWGLDWLRNRNTVEFLGMWETFYNSAFIYGEFAAIKSQAGLNSYKLSVKEWVEK